MMKRSVTLLILPLLISSCGKMGERMKQELLPTAGGDVGEIILVMDSAQWKGQLGTEIKSIFRSPMVGLPQDEALFELNRVNPVKLNNLLKSAANLVFVMTLDSETKESRVVRRFFTSQSLNKIRKDSSLWMTIRQDEFAKGQVVLYLFGRDEQSLLARLTENEKRIRDFFEAQAQKRTKQKIYRQRKEESEEAVLQTQDVSIQIPYGWDLAKNLKNFTWIRYLEADKELNVFIYQEPYTSASVFDDIPAFRDRITETYLRDSQKPELFIERQHILPVLQDKVDFNGNFAIKSRGLWKISDNSGGGPFISYTILDEEKQIVYYIEGYVYSPGTEKKNHVRKVDAVLSTFNSKTNSKP